MKVNQFCSILEKGFNVCGVIPIVAIPSGATRTAFGLVQMVAGTTLAFVGSCGEITSALVSGESRARGWRVLSRECTSHAFGHGPLNIFRGTLEFALGCLPPASLLLIPLNLKTNFEPLAHYRITCVESLCY